MKKTIEAAKLISKSLDNDCMEILEERNLHNIFQAIYNLHISIEDKNRIICFIIYSYDPDSLWLDLNKDRIENKIKILTSLGVNVDSIEYQTILYNKNEIVEMCVFNYLEELKDWRWQSIYNLLDYSSKMQRFSSQETETERKTDEKNKEGNKFTLIEEYDIDKISKVNLQKGAILESAIAKRRTAEALLEEIKKDFLHTDIATKSDYNFNLTDTSKKKDILSWRAYRKERNEQKLTANNQ